jgi:hypothetical protein
VNLRSRIEALERRARRDAPALVVLDLYDDDDVAAAERWLAARDTGAAQPLAVVVKLAIPRPPGKPPFWIGP